METKKLNRSFFRFLLIGFPLLCVLLFNPLNTRSQITYVDIDPDTTIDTNNGFYNLDLNVDGINDFQIKLSLLNENPRVTIYPLNDSCFFAYFMVEGCVFAKRFELNDSISNSTQWWNYSLGGILALTGTTSCGTHGAFKGQNDKYLGLKLIKNGITYFGWSRIDVASDVTWFTLKDYANSTSGLLAGQTITIVSDNSTLNTEIKVIDNTLDIIIVPPIKEKILYGVLINSCSQSKLISIKDNQIRISKANYQPGLYIVLFKTNSGNYSRKLIIK
jgi:hypothetical protein